MEHAKELTVSIDTFIGTFIICHKRTIKHNIHFYIIVFSHNVSHVLEYSVFGILEKLTRFDNIGTDNCTG